MYIFLLAYLKFSSIILTQLVHLLIYSHTNIAKFLLISNSISLEVKLLWLSVWFIHINKVSRYVLMLRHVGILEVTSCDKYCTILILKWICQSDLFLGCDTPSHQELIDPSLMVVDLTVLKIWSRYKYSHNISKWGHNDLLLAHDTPSLKMHQLAKIDGPWHPSLQDMIRTQFDNVYL